MDADGVEASNSAPTSPPPPPPPPVQLPSYPEMILEAIDALDNENGSNKTAISGYMKRKYSSSLPSLHPHILTAHLARMKTTGELHYEKNNYFLPDGDEEEEDPSERAESNDKDVPTPAHGAANDEEEEDPSDPADANDEDVSTPAHVAADAEEPGAASVVDPVVADCADGVPAPTTTPVAKRGRGRPPKPKASVADATVDAASAQVVASDAGAAPVKRGRGRPPKPKAPVAEATVDAAVEPVIANDNTAEITVDAAADPVVTNDTSSVPMKRGRGRPPKPKDPVAEAVSVATRGMPRARGRPPKKAKVANETPIGSSASLNSNADGANVVPVKRGRGRPPKVKP